MYGIKKIVIDAMEEKEICNLYKNGLSTKKIEKIIGIHTSKIKKILNSNGIDIHDPNRNFGPRKKMPDGYWNIKENNEKLASSCRNKSEFIKKSTVAYKISKKNNWILEYDEKYFSKNIKYYGFNDRIHVVYAYEFGTLNCVYVGRTMDLKRRHYCHTNPTQNDSVYNFCKKNNIKIPFPKILSEKLTAKESQKMEDKFKMQYFEKGWKLINKANTGENIGSLGASPRKWTFETCREAAETCKSKAEFKKKFSRAHNVSRKNGWIDTFFPENMKKENGCFDTFEKCLAESMKFKSIMDIRKNYPFLYHKISKNHWTQKIKEMLYT